MRKLWNNTGGAIWRCLNRLVRFFRMRKELRKAMEVFELSITNAERFSGKQDLVNEAALDHVETARRIYQSNSAVQSQAKNERS